MTTRTKKLKTDENGYVLRVRCDKGHSGNTRFVRLSKSSDYCACQGCGNFRDVASLIAEQPSTPNPSPL